MPIANAVNAQTAGVQCLTSAGVWNGRTITAGAGISVANGDGVSGNPTITATGGGLSTLYIFDDFLGFVSTASGVGNTNIAASLLGSGVIGTLSTDADHPGVITVTSDVASAGARLSTSSLLTVGGGQASCEWLVKLPVLSTGADQYRISIGILNNSAGSPFNTSNGCFFEYTDDVNSGQWRIVSIGAGTTAVNTTVAADTDWHNYKVIINSDNTSASFYIDGTQVSVSPIITNLPNAPIMPAVLVQGRSSGGGTAYVDFLRFQVDLTNAREG